MFLLLKRCRIGRDDVFSACNLLIVLFVWSKKDYIANACMFYVLLHMRRIQFARPPSDPLSYLRTFLLKKLFQYQFNLHIKLWMFVRESDEMDEDGSSRRSGKRQLKLSDIGFISSKRRSEEIESSGKGRCKFFEARKLEQLTHF